MSEENKYRGGVDEKPLSEKEYECLKNGGSLYPRTIAPRRKPKRTGSDDTVRIAV